ARPGRRVVATAAIAAALDIHRRFPDGDRRVVPACTAAPHTGVMDAQHHIPGITGVGRQTLLRRVDMRYLFRRRRHHAAHGGTGDAMAWRTLELSGDMAAFAAQVLMRAVERKPGRVVIEIGHRSENLAAR